MSGWWHPREREAAKRAYTIRRNTGKCVDHAHRFQSIPPLLSLVYPRWTGNIVANHPGFCLNIPQKH